MGSAVVEQLDRLRAALSPRYDLDREIGRGGMAVVYLARDRHHGRSVAIKVLRPDIGALLGPERFLREIRFAARLQHPHILPLYDSGTADGLLYYVMPYVEGESLRARIHTEKQLAVEEALRIAREIADALEYAHDHGVVHRDIKPGNILLSGGHAIVADFGVAKAMSAVDPESVTGTGIAIGTPEYMSPEQGSGDGHADRRTDIYAAGCVLYEMLAGSPPFTARTPQAVFARHRHEPPPSLSLVRPNLPAEVLLAVERALAKVPADRFQTAAAFAASLLPAPASSAGRPPARSRAHPGRIAAACAILALLGGATLLLRRDTPSAHSSIGVVVVPFEAAGESGSAGTTPVHLAFAGALEWVPRLHALDGSRLLGNQAASAIPLAELLQGAKRLGAEYLVTGTLLPGAEGLRLTAELYAVRSGERVVRSADTVAGAGVDAAVGRLALEPIRALAERERLDLGARKAMFASTSSAIALGQLIQGQGDFWRGDYDGAAAAFARAIAADSVCGIAYLRLSEVQSWRHEHSAALATLEAGLRHAGDLAPLAANLLRARRHYALGEADSAVAAFQNAVLDDSDDIDAWLGLGESLFHLGTYAGASPLEARGPLERMARLDSAFYPIYDHLVDIALYQGDSVRAAAWLRRMPPGDPATLARQDALVLRFGRPAARVEALRRLRDMDRQTLSRLVVLWVHGMADLPLADTIASYLTHSGRTPDDRRRGAQFRLVTLGARGHWNEGIAAWSRDAADRPFDGWVIHAWLAGHPVGRTAEPMVAWARSLLRRGTIPDFSLAPWEEAHQAFTALTHRATLVGDSAEILDLLEQMKSARPSADLSDPTAASLQASLEARLALLAGDSAATIGLLQRSLDRIYHPFTWYYPLTAMAPQRMLLARLLRARGAAADARRLEDSFERSWAIGDVLFAVRPLPAGTPFDSDAEVRHVSP